MAGQMNAAVLHKARDLRYERIPVPQPRPDEVLIRIRMNGLCGSDIHFFESGKLGPFRVTRPYVPGHEACGVVERPAADGRGPAQGARVAVEPGIPCRRCEWCKKGRYNLCPDVTFLSAPPVNGTFAEYAAVASDFAHPVPDPVSDEQAAFVEPISVGIQAAHRARLAPGMTVAILGSGPIGLVTYLVSRAYGATECYLFDVLDHRLALGRSLGATATVNSRTGDPAAKLMELTGGRGVDVVFDTSGSSAACRLAPELAARGGVLTLVGWPESRSFEYPIEPVIEKELDVRGVNRYCNTFPEAIALLAAGRLDVRPLVSHRYPFADVVEAFRFATENRSATVKVMIGG
jgi:L-iditol 2-dehydrogenase